MKFSDGITKQVCLLMALFIGGLFYVDAQDLIVLRDGNLIEAKVMEIHPSEIRYKSFDNLDGPTIVIPSSRVLSIKYENGKTDIINAASADNTVTVSSNNQPVLSPRFNTFGASLGYPGVSSFGLSANGTVSPSNYTFFDFGLGLGFSSFSFNLKTNFCVFMPFNNGGWYAGLGLGLGYSESGYAAFNLTTGFLFLNWLNISYTLQLGEKVGGVNSNISVGYAYRFNSSNDSSNGTTASVNNSTLSSGEVLIPDAGKIYALADIREGGRSTATASLDMEIIDGQEKAVINMEINLRSGVRPPWGSIVITDNDIVEKARIASGIRFKVLGDGGRKWFLQMATREVTDDGFYQYQINTRRNRVITVDIPYSRLRKSEWSLSNVRFNKDSIYELRFLTVIDHYDGLGSSSIKVFDIEFY